MSFSAFPDPVFREYLKGYDYGWDEYNSNGELYTVGENDGILGDKEIERITGISFSGNIGIRSLQGIEHLTALTTLGCSSNQLNALDVSGCTALTRLSYLNSEKKWPEGEENLRRLLRSQHEGLCLSP